MASFAKCLSLLLLIVLLSDSVGRSYGRDSFSFSKITPDSADEEYDVVFGDNEPVTQKEDGFLSQLTRQGADSNDDDDDGEQLTKSLRAYEQGIKYAKLVNKKMNSYGAKAVNNIGNNDGSDNSLNDALAAYARGVKLAKMAENKDVEDDDDDDDVNVKLVKDTDTENDGGDNSLNDSLAAYARGIKIAKTVQNKYVEDDDDDYDLNVKSGKDENDDDDDNMDVNEIAEEDDNDDDDDVGTKSVQDNDVETIDDDDDDDVNVNDIKNVEDKKAYKQGVKYAKYLNEDDDDDMP